jgi:hypothetical protein
MTNSIRNTAVFFLAHYDDEFGVFHQIKHHLKNNDRAVIIYLTSSHLLGETDFTREDESLRSLNSIGLTNKDDVFFIGREVCIPDLKLHENLRSAYQSSYKIIQELDNVKYIYTLSFEGGHPDHDATYLISVALSKKLNLLNNSYQFTLYSGKKLYASFFRLFSPIKENGEVLSSPVSIREGFEYFKLFLNYRSQPKTLLGLAPFFFFHILFVKKQYLQKISLHRIYQRPHEGKLLYERRGMCDYNEFRSAANLFIKEII